MSDAHVFTPSSPFVGDAETAIVQFYTDMAGIKLVGDVNPWWQKFTRVISPSKVITRFFIPLNAPRVKSWTGKNKFERPSNVFIDVRRGVYFIGVEESAEKIAEADFGGFSRSPEAIAAAVQKFPGEKFGHLLNTAHGVTDWTGTAFVVFSATKPIHPHKPALGTDWLNGYQSSALTAANIKRAIKNLQSRRGLDNKPLHFSGTTLNVPTGMEEDARDLVEVVQLTSVLGVDASTVVGGVTSTTFGRLKVQVIDDMRSDMWFVSHDSAGTGYELFANEDPEKVPSVPHIEPIMYLADSDRYKNSGYLAVGQKIREGHALLTPHCACFNYTGNAADAYTV